MTTSTREPASLPLAGERVTASDLVAWDCIEHDGRTLIVEGVSPEPGRPYALRVWVTPDWTEHDALTLSKWTKVTLAGDRIDPEPFRP